MTKNKELLNILQRITKSRKHGAWYYVQAKLIDKLNSLIEEK